MSSCRVLTQVGGTVGGADASFMTVGGANVMRTGCLVVTLGRWNDDMAVGGADVMLGGTMES